MYVVGEQIHLCYHMEPQNIGYTVRVTQTAPGSPAVVAQFNDNGGGGGDCIFLTVTENDYPGFTLVVQAFVANLTLTAPALSAKVTFGS